MKLGRPVFFFILCHSRFCLPLIVGKFQLVLSPPKLESILHKNSKNLEHIESNGRKRYRVSHCLHGTGGYEQTCGCVQSAPYISAIKSLDDGNGKDEVQLFRYFTFSFV